uniref:choice-of-anchor Y domain-containing protein n=1 Tax=Trichocoleus desertorum TaxID=1481672 RepID=UPI0025B4D673|nr:hypothetical protein [Trichocoleus desertorum]
MKVFLPTVTASLALALSATAAKAVVLYDGSSSPAQTPAQQNWLYQATAIATAPIATATSSGTVLDTGNSSNYAGYFNGTPVILDRAKGYTVSFKLRVNSESHGTNNNRAGFSVIVISKQGSGEAQPYGVELGFWLNNIWAQSSTFTRAETATYNTQSLAHTYHLKVSGNQYKLFVDNATTPILQGPMRQYTGYTPPAGYPNPYKIPNLMFWGDNTTSAKSRVTLMRVEAN